jgi:hypothetical protein
MNNKRKMKKKKKKLSDLLYLGSYLPILPDRKPHAAVVR